MQREGKKDLHKSEPELDNLSACRDKWLASYFIRTLDTRTVPTSASVLHCTGTASNLISIVMMMMMMIIIIIIIIISTPTAKGVRGSAECSEWYWGKS